MKHLISMKKMLIAAIALCCVGGMVLGAGKELGKSFKTLTRSWIRGVWYGSYQLSSPVFSLTGVVPEGATKLEITRTRDAQTGSFVMNVERWSEFSLNFRLGYGNLERGKNQYIFTFWEGERLRGKGFLALETHFQEFSFKDITMYLDEQILKQIKSGESSSFPVGAASQILVKYGDQFSVATGPIYYDDEKEQLYEGRNVSTTSGSSLVYGDLYLNGTSLAKNVPVAYQDSKSGNSLQFFHRPQQNVLGMVWGGKDGCKYSFNTQEISLSTKEILLDVIVFENLGDLPDDWQEGANGARLIYQNKKLEVFPVVTTGEKYALKYRYSVREKGVWRVIFEDNIVKDQIVEHPADISCAPTFSYRFDREKRQLIVKRDAAVGGKSETYTRNLVQMPSYYRTVP